MTTDPAPILIAGAGIGGLAAAIALARIGVRVQVLEQRAGGGEEGAGIQIGPNGVHALRQLGVADRLQPRATPIGHLEIREAGRDRCLTRLPLTGRMERLHGAPYWATRRSDLHAALLETARTHAAIEIVDGVQVRSCEGTRFDPKTGGVTVAAADGGTFEGRALIGADGLWSVVARSALGAGVPRFTGRTAARALVPVEALDGDQFRRFGGPVTGLWLGAKAHLVHYPVDAGRLLNIVAIFEGGQRGDDWGTPLDAGDLLPHFAGWAKPVRDLLARADGASGGWRTWSLLERAPLAQWSDGPVTVLGDAAHPMLPYLAQGAVMALEDAVTLAAAVADRPQDIGAAFEAYDVTRKARAGRVVTAARRNGWIYHLTGLSAAVRDTALSALPPERLIAGYDWLYGFRCSEHGGQPRAKE